MFYISFMVTTKEKHTADSQKIKRRELKHSSLRKIFSSQRKIIKRKEGASGTGKNEARK